MLLKNRHVICYESNNKRYFGKWAQEDEKIAFKQNMKDAKERLYEEALKAEEHAKMVEREDWEETLRYNKQNWRDQEDL